MNKHQLKTIQKIAIAKNNIIREQMEKLNEWIVKNKHEMCDYDSSSLWGCKAIATKYYLYTLINKEPTVFKFCDFHAEEMLSKKLYLIEIKEIDKNMYKTFQVVEC
jgi:hypothetical protein